MKKIKYLIIIFILSGCTYVTESPDCDNDTVFVTIHDTIVEIVYVPIYKPDTFFIKENLYVGLYDFKAAGLTPMPSIFDIPMNKNLSRVRAKFQTHHKNNGN